MVPNSRRALLPSVLPAALLLAATHATAFPGPLAAADPDPEVARSWAAPIVTPAEVRDALDDPSLVILHFGTEEEFGQGRIPGAVFARWQDFEALPENAGGLRRELPDPADFQATLRSLGVREDSRILVYYDSGLEANLTRILFTLDWAGLGDRSAAMMGGIEAWTRAGGAITTMGGGNPSQGNVVVRPRSDVVVTADEVEVLARTPGHVLIDGRAAAFHDGVRADQGKAGHIPGAANLPHLELFAEDRTYLPAEELRALLAQAGVGPGDRVVVYCHVGLFGTAIVTAARLLGHEAVLYDGSWEHWAASDRPVAVP